MLAGLETEDHSCCRSVGQGASCALQLGPRWEQACLSHSGKTVRREMRQGLGSVGAQGEQTSSEEAQGWLDQDQGVLPALVGSQACWGSDEEDALL